MFEVEFCEEFFWNIPSADVDRGEAVGRATHTTAHTKDTHTRRQKKG